GFIGSNLVRALQGRGEDVVITVRPTSSNVNLEGLDVRQVECDLTDYAQTLRALKGVDRVYHLAGFISVREEDRQRVFDVNHEATVNLLGACKEVGVERVVYLASIFALGAGEGDESADEDVEYTLDWYPVHYFQAKRLAELHARRMADEGLPIVFVYPTFCFGPGDVYLSSSEMIVEFMRGRVPAYVASGIDMLDVRDAAEGLILGMEKGKLGERYLITGYHVPYKELFERLSTLTGRPAPRARIPKWALVPMARLAERFSKRPPLTVQAALLMKRSWYYRGDKARRELGFRNRPLDETLRDAVAWFREHGYAK
ncbi:MAG: NAD-dependent epimerase/dehydratase family protein, partial [Myxococcales bacterium]|nr:NAD-dependent epimerase/dehydratase family protein [Myxococcales bacterium]